MSNPSGRDLAAELTVEQQAALGDLCDLERRLAGYVAPRPTAEETEALLTRLRPLVAARAETAPLAEAPGSAGEPAPAGGFRHWLALAWSQTPLMEPAFWWASGLLFALGLLLSALSAGRPLAVLLAIASPVVAAAGVAYAFRPATRTLWEMERSCPVSPLELLYARLGVVLAFNLLLSLALLTVLAFEQPRLVLWRLVLAWLGPMLGLAGAALYATVRWGSLAGAVVPLGLWTALVVTVWQRLLAGAQSLSVQLTEELVPQLSQSNAVLLASLGALALGLVLLRAGGRLAAGDERAWN